jgi:Ca2+-binding RTX toxin-like protein
MATLEEMLSAEQVIVESYISDSRTGTKDYFKAISKERGDLSDLTKEYKTIAKESSALHWQEYFLKTNAELIDLTQNFIPYINSLISSIPEDDLSGIRGLLEGDLLEANGYKNSLETMVLYETSFVLSEQIRRDNDQKIDNYIEEVNIKLSIFINDFYIGQYNDLLLYQNTDLFNPSADAYQSKFNEGELALENKIAGLKADLLLDATNQFLLDQIANLERYVSGGDLEIRASLSSSDDTIENVYINKINTINTNYQQEIEALRISEPSVSYDFYATLSEYEIYGVYKTENIKSEIILNKYVNQIKEELDILITNHSDNFKTKTIEIRSLLSDPTTTDLDDIAGVLIEVKDLKFQDYIEQNKYSISKYESTIEESVAFYKETVDNYSPLIYILETEINKFSNDFKDSFDLALGSLTTTDGYVHDYNSGELVAEFHIQDNIDILEQTNQEFLSEAFQVFQSDLGSVPDSTMLSEEYLPNITTYRVELENNRDTYIQDFTPSFLHQEELTNISLNDDSYTVTKGSLKNQLNVFSNDIGVEELGADIYNSTGTIIDSLSLSDLETNIWYEYYLSTPVEWTDNPYLSESIIDLAYTQDDWIPNYTSSNGEYIIKGNAFDNANHLSGIQRQEGNFLPEIIVDSTNAFQYGVAIEDLSRNDWQIPGDPNYNKEIYFIDSIFPQTQTGVDELGNYIEIIPIFQPDGAGTDEFSSDSLNQSYVLRDGIRIAQEISIDTVGKNSIVALSTEEGKTSYITEIEVTETEVIELLNDSQYNIYLEFQAANPTALLVKESLFKPEIYFNGLKYENFQANSIIIVNEVTEAEVYFSVLGSMAAEYNGSPVIFDLNGIESITKTEASNGVVEIEWGVNGPEFIYTPNIDYTGSDSFTYSAVTIEGDIKTATVNIDVTTEIVPPIHEITIVDDLAGTTAINTSIEISPLANDTDSNSTHTLTISTISVESGSGTAVIDSTNTKIKYLPQTGVEEDVIISYSVTDGADTQTGGYISLTVGIPSPPPPIIYPPPESGHIITLFEDNYSTGVNSIIEISPLENDTDSDSAHTLSLSVPSIVSGSGKINRPDPESPNFYYIPDLDVEEEVVISYSVTDGINTQTGGVINLTVGRRDHFPILMELESTTTEFDFSSSKDLEYVFNREIEFGSEISIKILKEEDGTFVEKYNYTAGSEYLRIENNTTDPYNPEGSLIINPVNDLEYGGKYKVIISDTSIVNKNVPDAYYDGLKDAATNIEIEATTNIANIVSKSHRFIDIFIGEKTLKETGHLKHGIHEDIGFKAYAENGVVEVTGYNSIKYTPNEGFVGTDYIIYKTKHDGSKNDREKMHKIEIKVMGWEELKSYENDKKDGDELSNAMISRKGQSKIDSGDGDDEIQLLADTFWEGSYFAINTETGQKFSLSGKNRFLDEIDGGQGADKILLTEESDAFFFEDSFSGHHSSSLLKSTERGVDSKERIEGIEEVLAGAGDDIVDLTSSNFVNNSDMLIDGGTGNDILWGGTGNNEILGGAGDDILFGGIGSDTLTGGTGSDIYQFTSKDGDDIITDMSIDDSIEFYYSVGDDISSSSLSLNSGTLTWVANTSETVNIDLSATITGNDISALVGQYTFNEIV